MEKENIEDWKPTYKGFGKNAGKTFPYDRSWFCSETGNIHHSEKAVLSCVHCSKRYYKPSKKE